MGQMLRCGGTVGNKTKDKRPSLQQQKQSDGINQSLNRGVSLSNVQDSWFMRAPPVMSAGAGEFHPFCISTSKSARIWDPDQGPRTIGSFGPKTYRLKHLHLQDHVGQRYLTLPCHSRRLFTPMMLPILEPDSTDLDRHRTRSRVPSDVCGEVQTRASNWHCSGQPLVDRVFKLLGCGPTSQPKTSSPGNAQDEHC